MDAGISSDNGEKPIKVRLFKSAELAPVVDLAGVDLHYLVGGDVLNGVLKVYDNRDTVVGDLHFSQTCVKLFLLEFTGGHTDIACALCRGCDTCSGTGLLNVDGNIRVKSLVCLAELLHDRTYGSGAVQRDRAGNSGGSICAGGVDGDVAVVSDDLLTVVGLNEGDEILSCGVAVELCLLIAYVERSCYNVITGLDVGYGALNDIYVECH